MKNLRTPSSFGTSNPPIRSPLAAKNGNIFANVGEQDITSNSISSQDELKTLKYQLAVVKEERELDKLRYEANLRELEAKFKSEGKRADDLEAEQTFLFAKQKESVDALSKARDEFSQQRTNFESTIDRLSRKSSQLQDQLEAVQSQLQVANARLNHDTNQLTLKVQTLDSNAQELDNELKATINTLNERCHEIAKNEETIGLLQIENENLKSVTQDIKQSEMIQRELTQQVAYIQQLETDLRSKNSHIRSLEDSHKVVEVIEQEKSNLLHKLRSMEDLREKLANSELQVIRLEEEKQKWLNFLDKNDNFSSPEDILRALMQERVERTSLLERLGRVEAQASQGSSILLQNDLSAVKDEVNGLRTQLDKEKRLRLRIQMQKDLATKESQFLKDQLKAYDSEETMTGNYDKQKAVRITELEALVLNLKETIETMAKDLNEKDQELASKSNSSQAGSQSIPNFEAFEETLSKSRALQNELDSSNSKLAVATREIEALKAERSNLEQSKASKQRILQLKDNPTSNFETVKLSMIQQLRRENRDLLNKNSDESLVPYSSLESLRLQLEQQTATIEDLQKRGERLKKVFYKKSLEIRESVYSVLGYRVDLLPNKKVRVKSKFAFNDEESLEFSPDAKGNFHLDASPVSMEYENLVTFWIKERSDISCFLAALTLEYFDRTTKAAKF